MQRGSHVNSPCQVTTWRYSNWEQADRTATTLIPLLFDHSRSDNSIRLISHFDGLPAPIPPLVCHNVRSVGNQIIVNAKTPHWKVFVVCILNFWIQLHYMRRTVKIPFRLCNLRGSFYVKHFRLPSTARVNITHIYVLWLHIWSYALRKRLRCCHLDPLDPNTNAKNDLPNCVVPGHFLELP